MNLSRPDRLARLDALAAAYVLGTLPARARARLARGAQTDTAIAATIREWEQRLLPLAEAALPITPPARLWRRIALRLGLDVVRPSERVPWWARMPFWRSVALASLVAVAVLAGLLLREQRLAEAPIVVVLAGPDARPALIASADRASRVMSVKAVGAAPVPPDRSLELWMLPEGAAPRSLGVLPPGGVARVRLSSLPNEAFVNVPALAVSLEQAGGSPTGAPQGPVLYTGRIERFQ